MNEDNNEVWTTFESKTRLVTLFKKPDDTIFPRSSSSTGCEQLCVEDLDGTTCPFHKHQRNSAITERPNCSNAIENAVETANYTVYQGGDLNEFFGCDVFVPKRFSEVCLVNDHYILVKIPETAQIQPKMSLQSSNFTTDPPAEASQSGNKFVRYLQCGNGRTRRITPTPITEKPADDSKTANNSWSTNGLMQEVFKSRTILKGNLKVLQPHNSTKIEKVASETVTEPETITDSTEPHDQASSVKVSFNAPLQTSLDNQVELEVHGRLESPPGDFSEPRKKTVTQVLPRPRRPFGLFFCRFFRSFSFRPSSRISSNTRKKINAVVYKTFFVTWAKDRERSTCPNCCVPKRALRRTRSAIF